MTDDDLDALLAVPLSGFVAARDALARSLRAEGERDRAAEIRALRRPPVSAWALDQAARAHPNLVSELLEVGAGLRAATSRAVQGDATELRSMRSGERGAVDALVNAALEIADGAGHRPTDELRRRITATSRAALVDSEVSALLSAGRLMAEHELPGFGFGDGDLAAALEASTAPKGTSGRPAEPDRHSLRAKERRARAVQLRADAEDAEAQAAEAEARAVEAEAQAEAAARAAGKARRRADRATAAAATAERDADAAEA